MIQPKKRILIIDDEPTVAKSMSRLLDPIFDVDISNSPSYGYGLVVSKTYDLIIVDGDLGPNKISGLSLINLIKFSWDVPCVLYTGEAQKARIEAKKKQRKPDGIIDKARPIYPDCLDFMA